MKINFETIPHEEQRYETVGDWWIDEKGDWRIRVSKMSDWRYEFLVFFHEILEMAWCQWKEIKEEDVSAFDIQFEKNRPEGDLESEPGNDPQAPYWYGHQIATICEKTAAFILGVNWEEYDNEVMNL